MSYPETDREEALGPSKTRVKQAMHDLQGLGEELLKLSASQLDNMCLDPRLREALREHGRMPTREARRRHMQFIGRILRETDAEKPRLALEQLRAGSTRVLNDAEQWRSRLLDEDRAMTQWVDQHPQTDVQALRVRIRAARKELASNAEKQARSQAEERKPRLKTKAQKALFQQLKSLIEQRDRAG